MTVKKAVLLAAGRGKRLRPATDHTPKPLLVHQGKPTLDYLMDSLALAGIDDVILVSHHLHTQIDDYALKRSQESDQIVRCVRQAELLGTASATDYLLPANFFPDLIRFHDSHGMEFTASLKQLPEEELQSRSSVRFRNCRKACSRASSEFYRRQPDVRAAGIDK